MPEATRILSEIRLSRLTRDPTLRRWFESREPDPDATATDNRPVLLRGGAAAALVLA
jgi:hypothetical protein